MGYKKDVGPTDKDYNSWKGQGDWEEDWGEAYSGKKHPALFVININRLDNFLFFPWTFYMQQ